MEEEYPPHACILVKSIIRTGCRVRGLGGEIRNRNSTARDEKLSILGLPTYIFSFQILYRTLPRLNIWYVVFHPISFEL
jgi:hypothetical protein